MDYARWAYLKLHHCHRARHRSSRLRDFQAPHLQKAQIVHRLMSNTHSLSADPAVRQGVRFAAPTQSGREFLSAAITTHPRDPSGKADEMTMGHFNLGAQINGCFWSGSPVPPCNSSKIRGQDLMRRFSEADLGRVAQVIRYSLGAEGCISPSFRSASGAAGTIHP